MTSRWAQISAGVPEASTLPRLSTVTRRRYRKSSPHDARPRARPSPLADGDDEAPSRLISSTDSLLRARRAIEEEDAASARALSPRNAARCVASGPTARKRAAPTRPPPAPPSLPRADEPRHDDGGKAPEATPQSCRGLASCRRPSRFRGRKCRRSPAGSGRCGRCAGRRAYAENAAAGPCRPVALTWGAWYPKSRSISWSCRFHWGQ